MSAARPGPERCDFSDLPPDQCAHCLGHAGAPEPVDGLLVQPGWFPARYPDRCVECGEPFDADTPIQRVDDGWIAECCREAT